VDGGEDEVAVTVLCKIGMGSAVAGPVVVCGTAVELDLVIALGTPAADEAPVGGGGKGISSAVEFVGPDEVPALSVCGGGGQEDK
jgi:hypothetical protein